MPHLTFYYEFASTYSYLSAARIEDLARAHRVEIVWRPFLLGPIFAAQGWTTSPFNLFPAKGAHMWRDMERLVAKYDLPPLTRPDPFPQNGLLAARLALVGMAQGWGPAFTRAVYDLQFARGGHIDDETALCAILEDLGLDSTTLWQAAKADATVKAALRAITEEAQQLGLFGAPSFVTEDGEVFWGNDRLEDALIWAAEINYT